MTNEPSSETRARVIIAELREELAATERRLVVLNSVIGDLTELYPEVSDGVTADRVRLRGRAAVAKVLASFPGRPFTIAGLVQVLASHGWLPKNSNDPAAAVRQSLVRLVADDARVSRVPDSFPVAYVWSEAVDATPGGGS